MVDSIVFLLLTASSHILFYVLASSFRSISFFFHIVLKIEARKKPITEIIIRECDVVDVKEEMNKQMFQRM